MDSRKSYAVVVMGGGTSRRHSSGSLYDLRRHLYSGMKGLGNYGLSCCVNALLQSFSATCELKNLLDRWNEPSMRQPTLNVPLQLKIALGAIQDPSDRVPHRKFLQCLDLQNIRLHVQHDADEVFLAVLNFIQQHMDDKDLAREIQSLYQISVEHHLQCRKCSFIKPQTSSSYLLSLPLALKEDRPNTLKGCLESFFQLQELSGIDCCFCPQCSSQTPSKQGLKLLSLPTILVVQLQRFRYGVGKLDCSVEFPESFDFQNILSQDKFSKDFTLKDNMRYSLFAVVVHAGSVMCGHYTAYVRPGPERGWFYADDSNVEEASWEEVTNTYGDGNRNTAYMLLYRRMLGGAGGAGQDQDTEGPSCS